MGLSEKIKMMMAGIITMLAVSGNAVSVCAADYEVRLNVPPEERDRYTVITQQGYKYEVLEGDSLWKIASLFLGNGGDYPLLVEQNADIIRNPDLIYPQMKLQVCWDVYVPKRTGVNGLKMTEFRFGTPDRWSFGIVGEGDAYANCAFSGNNMDNVVCLVRTKEEAGVKSLSDWEDCKQKILSYAEKNYPEQVSKLRFSEYRMADGAGLYLFSFDYTIDGEQYGYRGSIDIHVSEGICQTENIQAEFTGFSMDQDMTDIVLYMLASFEEFPGAGDGRQPGTAYNNITIEPSEPWELSGIHNPFAWIDQYFDAVLDAILGRPAEKTSARDRILNR